MTSIVRVTVMLLISYSAVAASPESGLRLLLEETLSPRLSELSFDTPALISASIWVPFPTKVRILLPNDYGTSKGKRYPVLYLYHGGLEDQTAWTDKAKGALEQVANMPFIIVMPDGGPVGFYKNWHSDIPALGTGKPEWQVFHIDQLIPWIDSNYRTIPHRSARAVAGLSMGGFGAFSYAARHPDLIGIAASFSGALDCTNPASQMRESAQEGIASGVFGLYHTEEIFWRGVNPVDLASNLRNTDLSIYTGDSGFPETVIYEDGLLMHERLNIMDVEHRYTVYPGETHRWENFRQSFIDWVPHLIAAYSQVDDPVSFSFSSIESGYDIYGWSVALQRKVTEFSALTVSDNDYFEMVGNGRAEILTAALYSPGERYVITIKNKLGVMHSIARADPHGRLTIIALLGDENVHQQFSENPVSLTASEYTEAVPFTMQGDSSVFNKTMVSIKKRGE